MSTSQTSASSPVLAIRLADIYKSFGPVPANRGASLEVATGEIHALVGENGAGKSTLMRVLSGMYSPESGRMEVRGRDVTGWSTADAIDAGVGMVHQHFMLVPTLTVAENIVLGRELTSGGQLDRARAERDVAELSRKTGLAVRPERKVADLSVGEAQRVEILKTLYRGAKILILDEPTAVLSPPEIDELWQVLRQMRDRGETIVLITHKLDEVMEISDTITVMRQGATVARLRTATTTPAEIAKAMVGRDVQLAMNYVDGERGVRSAASARLTASEPLLAVRDLIVDDARRLTAVNGVTFAIEPGEILGIAGVEGNGQTELLDALAGLRPVRSGRIDIGRFEITHLPVKARGDAGLSHIPEDRHARGLILDYSIAENLILGQQHRFTTGMKLDQDRIAENARAQIAAFDIRPADALAPARSLSGGNQQKIVIAREMGRAFRVLLAAQPTRGVDVGAIEFIHARLREARDAGKAILLVSADLAEILALSDRIAVMYSGKFAAVLPRRDATQEILGSYMTGATATGEHARMMNRAAVEEAVLPAIVGLLVAAIVGDILILSFGQNPGTVYRLLIEGTWGNAYGLGQVLYKATTLTFTGLAVAVGLRAGLFNIGAESQLAAGGFVAALVGLILPAGVPALLTLPVYLLAAAIGGGVVGGIPGVLKAKFGAHEVITTIMLNFIVLALLNYLTAAHLKFGDSLHTAEIHAGALPRLSAYVSAFHGSAANVFIFIAILAAAVTAWFLFRTRRGFELRATGLQPAAAEYGGVDVRSVWWRAMALSGALAGMGGLNYVLGYKHYYEEAFASGAGFLGIAVAIVGRNSPLGVVLAALIFATISQGGLAVNAVVPKQMVDVLQAVVIIAVVASVPEVRRVLRKSR